MSTAVQQEPSWPVVYSRRAALHHSRLDPRGLPPGARRAGTPGADASKAARVPVVLVHGTNGRSSCDWFTLAPLLANDGFRVFPFDWRRQTPGEPVSSGSSGSSATECHADELRVFLDLVCETTGSREVDLVGHSWGAVVAETMLHRPPSAPSGPVVRRLVGLAPTYAGTTAWGLAQQQRRLPARAEAWLDAKIPTWREQLPGSEVLTRLHTSAAAQDGVRRTIIVTRWDQVVRPYDASFAAFPRADHLVLQHHDPSARVGHIGLLHHRVALRLAHAALSAPATPDESVPGPSRHPREQR